ncbi:MAG: FAD:protein FMN transferase [Treponema sp.]|jgi:thiamine biosynthesis lipoprotein|nr:FAD:protein FMN transferase [Treponema sp.]
METGVNIRCETAEGKAGAAKMMKKSRSGPAAAVPVFLLFLAAWGQSACGRTVPGRTEFVLGTVCSVDLYGKGSRRLYDRIFSRIREIEETMSANTADTELDRINRNAGLEPVKAGEDLLQVLEWAVHYAGTSGGAFDPTVGPLVRLWGIGTERERVPSGEEIAGALALVNWQDLVIDREEGTAFLKRRGMALDLGAIAKGYAADEAARVAVEGGIGRGVLELGGNILVIGSRSWNRPWRIGIQDPREGRGAYLGILLVRGRSVVTSGVYERFFEEGGRRYHHILSTADGCPVRNGLLSVTIVAARSVDADALSTAVFALGYEKGRRLVEAAPDTEAIFVFEDLRIRLTGGIRKDFSLTNREYRLEP